MTIRGVGFALHEELDRREKLIAVLQEECGAIRTTLAIVERGGTTPEAQNRVTRVVGHGRKKKAASEGGGYRCGCGRAFANRFGLSGHARFCAQKDRSPATETEAD